MIGLLLAGLTVIISVIAHSAPLTLVPGELTSGQIFLPCEFDARADLCFLDTGATITSVAKSDFLDNYPSHGEKQIGGAAGIKLTCDEINVNKLSIPLELEVHDFEVLRCEPQTTNKNVLVNTIGINVFYNQSLYFDFELNSLSVIKSLPEKVDKHPLTVHDTGHMSLPLSISGMNPFYSLRNKLEGRMGYWRGALSGKSRLCE